MSAKAPRIVLVSKFFIDAFVIMQRLFLGLSSFRNLCWLVNLLNPLSTVVAEEVDNVFINEFDISTIRVLPADIDRSVPEPYDVSSVSCEKKPNLSS